MSDSDGDAAVRAAQQIDAVAVFGDQDSGCVSYGVETGQGRWFVKRAMTPAARESLARACALHSRVQHDAIVRPDTVLDGPEGLTLVYQWRDGAVLNHATVHGSDRSALDRFQTLRVAEVEEAIDAILAAHLAIADAGYVAVDLYDGCFLYDFAAHRMQLIDLDEYRPGPFVLELDRLPGSLSYMAPEEFLRGSVIDERTNVYTLGRVMHHLLSSASGWRGSVSQQRVVDRATQDDPRDRHSDVNAFVTAWRQA